MLFGKWVRVTPVKVGTVMQELIALLASLWMLLFVTNNESILALTAGLPWLYKLINTLGNLGWGVLLPLFLLTFPDGRFVPHWTRRLFLLYAFLSVVLYTFEPFVPALAAIDQAISPFSWLSMQLLGACSQVYRYLRVADPLQRQQTKWIALGLFAAVLMTVLFFTVLTNYGPLGELVATAAGSVAFLLIPIAIGFSILRYRLWDIDRLINRTLVYGSLTAVLGGVYFGSIILLQGLFTAVTGQESPLSIVISTLVIAALFTPVRRRTQDFIDRRFFRRKYDATQALAQFAIAARDEVDLAALSNSLLLTVQETLQPQHSSLWLNRSDAGQVNNM